MRELRDAGSWMHDTGRTRQVASYRPKSEFGAPIFAPQPAKTADFSLSASTTLLLLPHLLPQPAPLRFAEPLLSVGSGGRRGG